MSALHQARRIHKIKKTISKLTISSLVRRSRRNSPAALQDHYKLIINLTTSKTGKHSINLTPNMLINVQVPGPRRNYFRIGRTPNQAPYAKKPIKGKNKEWDTLQKNIEKLLREILKPGHQIHLPNPLYPHDSKRDLVFHITQYIWKRHSHPSSLGNYKFIINVDADNNLVVAINVKLEGHWVKDAHIIAEPKPPQPPPKHFGERITRACDAHLAAVRDLVSSYQESRKYEKKMQHRKEEEASAKIRVQMRQTRRRGHTAAAAAARAARERALPRARRQTRRRGRTAATAAAAAARRRSRGRVQGGGRRRRYKTRRRRRRK